MVMSRVAADCPFLFGGLAAFDGFSSSRDKVTQKVTDSGTFSAPGRCHEHWLHAFDIVIMVFFQFFGFAADIFFVHKQDNANESTRVRARV